MNQIDRNNELKNIIEALLFVNERPLNLEQLKSLFEEQDLKNIKQAVFDLQNDYEREKRGLKIVEVAGGYQMVSNPNYTGILRKFYKRVKKEKLKGPSLETLAIIVYKQPVTRLDIESIRGVNTQGVIDTLTQRGLIRPVGRKRAPGRPLLYSTTRQFLEYFGLKSLNDLPKFEEFAKFTQETIPVEANK